MNTILDHSQEEIPLRLEEDKEEILLKSEENFDTLRFTIAERLVSFLLPVFKKELIDDTLWDTAFILTPRNIGKTYNTSLILLIFMLKMGKDATAVRKYKTKVKGSLAKSIRRAFLENVQEYSQYFTFGKEHIRFKVEDQQLTLTLEGIADPYGFKGSEDTLLWIDEAEQFSQTDFGLIMPTIRSAKNTHKRIITSNIPVEGKKSWLYKEFVEKQPEGSKYISLSFKDNPIIFPDEKAISKWKESQRPYFRGRPGAFEREIEGTWPENSSYNIFKNGRVIDNPDLKPNLLVMLYESGVYFSLGIHVTTRQLAIVGEYFTPISPLELPKDLNIILHTPTLLPMLQESYELLSRSVACEPCSLDKLATYFSCHELLVNQNCLLALEEITLASFDVQDTSVYLLEKKLTKNIKGLVIKALQILCSWLT